MDFRKKVLGAQHPDTLTSINNLGSTLRSMGRLSDAEQLHREVGSCSFFCHFVEV